MGDVSKRVVTFVIAMLHESVLYLSQIQVAMLRENETQRHAVVNNLERDAPLFERMRGKLGGIFELFIYESIHSGRDLPNLPETNVFSIRPQWNDDCCIPSEAEFEVVILRIVIVNVKQFCWNPNFLQIINREFSSQMMMGKIQLG
jgi:hypothetical protein